MITEPMFVTVYCEFGKEVFIALIGAKTMDILKGAEDLSFINQDMAIYELLKKENPGMSVLAHKMDGRPYYPIYLEKNDVKVGQLYIHIENLYDSGTLIYTS